MLYPLYRALTSAAEPLVRLYLRLRLSRGKEDPARLPERFGSASLARPEGTLIWIHGASVGESVSALPLIAGLRERHPAATILLTTGTVTSAALMKERLPDGVLHQFVPVDTPGAVTRFLDHWRPDLALWLESELWPTLVLETAKRCPMLLVNARMSEASLRGWRRFPGLAARLVNAFVEILPQSATDAERLQALGATRIGHIGNLKHDAPPLPADETALATLRAAVGERPVWVAASTHAPEEETVASAHRAVSAKLPGLLTVLVPRHANRGDALATQLHAAGLEVRQRSKGALPDTTTAVYLADTMGELGLFYRLAEVVFIGGSLVEHGGQNPLEPARLGCAIITGPHTFNFADIYADMQSRGACAWIPDTDALADAVHHLLTDAVEREEFITAARLYADAMGGATEAILDTAGKYLHAHA